EIYRDSETGEVTLSIKSRYGDKVYYDIDAEPTTGSMEVNDLNNFKTKELKLNFLCIDSSGVNETGEVYHWNNKIELKYRQFTKNNNRYIELKAIPEATIKYTTDGSNPKEHGGIYDESFIIPPNTVYVSAIAEKDGIESNKLEIKIDKETADPKEIQVNKIKPLKLRKNMRINETAEVYKELERFKKFSVKISDISVYISTYKDTEKWIEISTGKEALIEGAKLESQIENIRTNLFEGEKIDINLDYQQAYFESGQSFLDMVADKKMALEDFKEEEIEQ
ncbi:MAG: chitobiase/beta-hexosaminidase C-terminal domain-containing protein, partial [Romboutsia timonensis]|uniref:chitobiase/beta-hexosaminidase C-terminal domain-containing protein n=1 Tax=Romboutsia timonensis TaxID=1776391 RepID=UPI002A747533